MFGIIELVRDTRLIILRGPSGSGKTTTAKTLFDGAKRRTVLIEQDYYRFIFNPPGGGEKPNSDTIHKMIKNDVLTALGDGYDVILEGILSVKAYEQILEEIFQQHTQNNYIFYFNISFEETVKRHKHRQAVGMQSVDKSKLVQDQKRNQRLQEFDEHDMQQWYADAHRSGHELEHIIPETSSAQQTIEFIKQIIKS